ncbi:MAG: hypothetical protein HY647_04020 [Acidobacteria bacterium]|nr:hypothetical protein [Acidobacteriota bacterium]
MARMLVKAAGIWILFVPLAILNGIVREKLLVPWLGQTGALPLSGVLLSVLIFLLTLLLLPFLKVSIAFQYWVVGGLWFLLTIAFEFLFGHYVVGESWTKLWEVFNVFEGNLWLLALLTTACSPYLAARLRGLTDRRANG